MSENMLERYAEIIVRQGLAVQPGQVVNISGEVVHRALMLAVARQCYRAGAKYATYDLIDPELERAHIVLAPEEGLDIVPSHVTARYDEILQNSGCNLRIVGSEDPRFWQGVDSTRLSRVTKRKLEARTTFLDKGINQGGVQWCVAAGATPGWAQQVYPDLAPESALERLWDQLFRLVWADLEDPIAQWSAHAQRLKERCAWLDGLRIRELLFTGDGTELRVALSDKATFCGGTKKAASGVEFTANLPTYEVFTTPDWRGTSGRVRITRPVTVQGKIVEGLEVEFVNGRVTTFTAKAGEDAFRGLIDTDDGARQLGEIALVDTNSPVFQSGTVFNEILLDENASCHFALGSAYKACLREGPEMNEEELKQVGCNISRVHTDFMISDENTNVFALTSDGATVPIIQSGQFVC